MNILEGTHLIPNATVFSTATVTDIPPETKVLLWMTPDPLPELPPYLCILIAPYIEQIDLVPETLFQLVTDTDTVINCRLPFHCVLIKRKRSDKYKAEMPVFTLRTELPPNDLFM